MIKIKTVVVGESGTGKSCLITRYVDNTFYETPENKHPTTIGAIFRPKTITIEGEEVTFDIWDTGGQKQYQHFAPTFCTGAKAAIVCFDLNKEETFEVAQTWVNKLSILAPNCKIYMCGTRKDKVSHQKLIFSGFYAKIHGFCEVIGAPYYETSAKNNEGINDLFNGIASRYLDYMMKIETRHVLSIKKRKLKASKDDCCPWKCICNLG